MEKNDALNRSTVSAAAGTSTMIPRGGSAAGTPSDCSLRDCIGKQIAARLEFFRRRHHRKHDLEISADRGTRERAQLDGKYIRTLQT